jgi:hypothetical protein
MIFSPRHIIPEGAAATRDVVLACARICGASVLYVHPRLARDREVILAALGPDHPNSVTHTTVSALLCRHVLKQEALLLDDAVLRALVRHDAFRLAIVPPHLRDDRRVVLAHLVAAGEATQKYRTDVALVSDRLRADREVALAAVAADGGSVRFLHPSLRSDRQVALAAVRTRGSAIRWVDATLLTNEELCLAAVRRARHARHAVAICMRCIGWESRAVALEAVRSRCEYVLSLAPERVRDDDEIAIAAVTTNGVALEHVSDRLRRDVRVCFLAMRSDASAREYVGEIATSFGRSLIDAAAGGVAEHHLFAVLRRAEAMRQEGVVRVLSALAPHLDQLEADECEDLVARMCHPSSLVAELDRWRYGADALPAPRSTGGGEGV